MANDFLKKVEKRIRHWYLPLIIGILSIAIGIWTIVTPAESYLALSIVFAVLFFMNGIFGTVFAISNRGSQWGWSFVFGILGIILGFILMTNPLVSAATLAIYVGFMLLFYSILGLSVAISDKEFLGTAGTSLTFLSILGLILSIIILWNPYLGGISVVLWTGFAFLSVGSFMITLSLRLRKVNKLMRSND